MLDLNSMQDERGRLGVLKGLKGALHSQALGAAEEVGELCHAHLKYEEGLISRETYLKKAGDAVGDTIVMLLGYCHINGLKIEECIDMAWTEFVNRDFQKHYRQKENDVHTAGGS